MDQLDARGVGEKDLAVGGEDLAVLRIRVEQPTVESERPAPPARAELGRGQVGDDPGVLRLLARQRLEAPARLSGRAPGHVEPGSQPAQPRRRGIVGQVAIHRRARLVELPRLHEQLCVVLAQAAVVRVALEQRAVRRERLLDQAESGQDARPHHLRLERVDGLRRGGGGGRRLSARRGDRGAQGRAQAQQESPQQASPLKESPLQESQDAREADRAHRASMAGASAAFKEDGAAAPVSGGGRAGAGAPARTRRARAPRPDRPRRARPGGSGPRSRRP